MKPLFAKLLANRHTSAAAVLYAIGAFGCPLLAVWWPSHQAQLDSSRKIIEAVAVFYGFAAAGDASATAKPDSTAVPPTTTPTKTP